MSAAFVLITLQAILGALDTLWHHEIAEQLPARRSAASELSLHAACELLYAFLFLAFAWFQWQGGWSALLAGVLLAEGAIALADFIVEDRTRQLSAFERVLHTILAINYGAILALLAPILLGWWQMPSFVVGASHPFSWAFTVFAAAALIGSARNALAVLSLRQPAEWVRNPIACGSSAAPRTVLISGATGFIGGHLVRRLLARGDKVIVFTRRPEVALDRFGPHVKVVSDLDSLEASTRIDAMVNLAGSPTLGLPWTASRREELVGSRLGATRALITFLSRALNPVGVFVSASAVGFYGVTGDEIVDEAGRPMPIFQSRMCQDWEAAARAAARLNVRLVRLRMGLVLGADGGALPRLALPVRMGLGAILGTGRQWVSWIHIDDLVRLIEFAIDNPAVRGAVNAVSPAPVTHQELQQALARILRRFIGLRVPRFLLRLALGEMAQLLIDGQRIVPTRATALGFKLRHPRIDEALRSLLRPAAPDLSTAEVFFNGECRVCRFEMKRYAALSRRAKPEMRFVDSTRHARGLTACLLRSEHLERRLYLRSADGRILSGMPAVLAIWASLPQYRLLSKIWSLPLLRPLAVLLYDHAISRLLAFWARRRAGQNMPTPGGP
jgi:uncharacterized protein (TIGR01777 family)